MPDTQPNYCGEVFCSPSDHRPLVTCELSKGHTGQHLGRASVFDGEEGYLDVALYWQRTSPARRVYLTPDKILMTLDG